MDTKDRLDFALNATATGMWSYEMDGGRFTCDARIRQLWGLPAIGEVSLGDFVDAAGETGGPVLSAHILGHTPAWPDEDVEVHIKRVADGSGRWVAIRGQRATIDGRREVVGTGRDITESKSHDTQVHLLMREVTHRSKNLLAIIQAMARRTVKHSLTASDFEERFSARLRGLAFSHEILASQDWRGASVKDLVAGHLNDLLEHHADRIRISGPILFIRPEAAQNLGLALNELSTNAAKFGALARGWGQVSFHWQLETDETGPRWLRFTWHETGDERRDPPPRKGFGHEVMERVVARALDGIVQTTYPAKGFEWSLRIPVSHICLEDTTA